MANIELVIKIDEEDYKIMRHNIAVNNPLCPLSQEEMVSKVANGVPLPKGHGDLIDRKDVSLWTAHLVDGIFICDAPTIIEADKYKVESED